MHGINTHNARATIGLGWKLEQSSSSRSQEARVSLKERWE